MGTPAMASSTLRNRRLSSADGRSRAGAASCPITSANYQADPRPFTPRSLRLSGEPCGPGLPSWEELPLRRLRRHLPINGEELPLRRLRRHLHIMGRSCPSGGFAATSTSWGGVAPPAASPPPPHKWGGVEFNSLTKKRGGACSGHRLDREGHRVTRLWFIRAALRPLPPLGGQPLR